MDARILNYIMNKINLTLIGSSLKFAEK